ncbi:hypothetical protein HYPSUDRAFT_150573 [Hypholoma sublateritium FD-334 SS-4]|uniref:Cytochrome P450 n=1 Tax=Hypholoma sublateritium (strain FD-334 SS-4) TaxID=945553 RepID=A0A0D2P0Y8_HYPSF|nr:hypothetical protein HYPSUDRAFT_150573 [Hypholoma sublateritium FD-334 SS-4]
MALPPALLLLLLALAAAAALRPVARLLWRQLRSPLRALPGPPAPSWLYGNLAELHEQENTGLVARWTARYGPILVYRGFLSGPRLLTTDPVAIAHVLGNADDYPKPDFVRDSLAAMTAGRDGLLVVEGTVHRRQRKILAPAFSAAHIRTLTPIFYDKATELRDIWLATLDATDPRPKRTDVLAGLGRATLDVIGLAGFGYAFDALTDDTNELARAFAVVFATARRFRAMTVLQAWFPVLRRFRWDGAPMRAAQATMRRVGLALIEEKLRAAADELRPQAGARKAASTPITPTSAPTPASPTSRVRAVRANTAAAPAQRMSVPEILCQITTLLAAGHETTASALTWALYALARAPGVQARLRAAVRGAADEAEAEAYAAAAARCTYLDWVVREALRLHAPVTSTMRVCARAEDAIPLTPGNGLAPANGNGGGRTSVAVRRGDIITIPIQAVGRDVGVWGEDAGVFRPERWAAPPARARAVPGLWGSTLTFLNGNPLSGNRACIGYKFALLEIKIFLFVLVKDIEFAMDPALVVEKSVNVVTRPFVKSEPHLGNQMPLNITRAPCAPPCPANSVARCEEDH